jgi:hypothetical protein
MGVALAKYTTHYNKLAEEASFKHRTQFHNCRLMGCFAKKTLNMVACGPVAK